MSLFWFPHARLGYLDLFGVYRDFSLGPGLKDLTMRCRGCCRPGICREHLIEESRSAPHEKGTSDYLRGPGV